MRGTAVTAAASLLLLVGAGCGDDGGDEEPSAGVTQEAYAAEAERLCAQHGDVIARAYVEVQPDSDAEEAAFYTSDFIPRTRALIRRLAEHGFPAERADDYRAELEQAMAVLAELEADPFGYIDDRHRQAVPPEEDLLTRIRVALDGADIPC